MKYLLFNFMLYSRGVFFVIVKAVALLLLVSGVGVFFSLPTLGGKLLGLPLVVGAFLLFLLRRSYDGILLRLRPDGTSLILPMD